jgi:hypothetical protein
MSHSLKKKNKNEGYGGGAGTPPPGPVRWHPVRPRSGGARSGPSPAAAAASTHLMNEMYTTWGLPWLSQARS